MEDNQVEKVMMRLAMSGLFHGTFAQSQNIFEYFLKHGNSQASDTAHAGMGLLAMSSGRLPAAIQIIGMLENTSAEVLGIRALIYKLAKNGNADKMLEELENSGSEGKEFAAEIRKVN